MTHTTFCKLTPTLAANDGRWIVEVPTEHGDDAREPSPRSFGRSLLNRAQRYLFHREEEARRFLCLFQRPARNHLAFR